MGHLTAPGDKASHKTPPERNPHHLQHTHQHLQTPSPHTQLEQTHANIYNYPAQKHANIYKHNTHTHTYAEIYKPQYTHTHTFTNQYTHKQANIYKHYTNKNNGPSPPTATASSRSFTTCSHCQMKSPAIKSPLTFPAGNSLDPAGSHLSLPHPRWDGGRGYGWLLRLRRR